MDTEIVRGCVTSAERRWAPEIARRKRDVVRSEAGGVGCVRG